MQSIALPTGPSDGNAALTASGLSRSEGLISRSADGKYLAITGYDAGVGATGPGWCLAHRVGPRHGRPRRRPGRRQRDRGHEHVADRGRRAEDHPVRADRRRPDLGHRRQRRDPHHHPRLRHAAAPWPAPPPRTSTRSPPRAASCSPAASSPTGSRRSAPASRRRAPTLADVPGLPANLLAYGYAFFNLTGDGWAGTDLDTLYLANASNKGGTLDKYRYNGSTWTLAQSKDVPGISGLVASLNTGNVSIAATTPSALVKVLDTGAAGTATLGHPVRRWPPRPRAPSSAASRWRRPAPPARRRTSAARPPARPSTSRRPASRSRCTRSRRAARSPASRSPSAPVRSTRPRAPVTCGPGPSRTPASPPAPPR